MEPVAAGHLHPVLRVTAARPGGHRHLAVGDQPGLRLGRQVPAEPVAPLRLALAGMPCLAVHGADHPVRGDLPGDPPPPIGPIGVLSGLHVLPGHQRQQAQRVRRRGVPAGGIRARQLREYRQRVIDQGTDQGSLGVRIIPVDRRLARLGVIQRAHRRDHIRRARHHPCHLAHRGHQLGDGVLGRHRVVENRRVHAPLPPAAQDASLGDHLRDRIKDPVRATGLRDPFAPVHQRGRSKLTWVSDGAGHLPPDVILQRVRRRGSDRSYSSFSTSTLPTRSAGTTGARSAKGTSQR